MRVITKTCVCNNSKCFPDFLFIHAQFLFVAQSDTSRSQFCIQRISTQCLIWMRLVSGVYFCIQNYSLPSHFHLCRSAQFMPSPLRACWTALWRSGERVESGTMLRVIVCSATNIPNLEKFGKSDPYCLVLFQGKRASGLWSSHPQPCDLWLRDMSNFHADR